MPTYSSSTYQVPSMSGGAVGYSFGYAPLTNGTLKSVTVAATSSARSTNVVTVTTTTDHSFQIGQSVVIAGAAPAGATTFNGTFTIVSAADKRTFTYAQTAADDTSTGGTATSGTTGEVVPANGTAGVQFALQNNTPFPDEGRTVTYQHSYTTAPGAVTVALQGAISDVEADYKTLDSDNTAAGNTKTVTGVRANFLRLKITALTLTNGVGMVGRILA